MKRSPNKTALQSFLDKEERAIDNIVRELEESGEYDWVSKHVTYCANGLNGEYDIYAGRDNVRLYGERKGSDRGKVIRHAIHQFKRAKLAHPEFDWRFTLYTPSGKREYSL